MSAIVAGKACKSCGKEFWQSLGHPLWFDEPESHPDQWALYVRLARSGKCMRCFIKENEPLTPLFEF